MSTVSSFISLAITLFLMTGENRRGLRLSTLLIWEDGREAYRSQYKTLFIYGY